MTLQSFLEKLYETRVKGLNFNYRRNFYPWWCFINIFLNKPNSPVLDTITGYMPSPLSSLRVFFYLFFVHSLFFFCFITISTGYLKKKKLQKQNMDRERAVLFKTKQPNFAKTICYQQIKNLCWQYCFFFLEQNNVAERLRMQRCKRWARKYYNNTP